MKLTKKKILMILAALAVLAGLSMIPKKKRQMPPMEETVYTVKSEAVSKSDLQEYLRLNGTVKAENTISVYPDIGGKLTRVPVTLGSYVKKGQLIAEVERTKNEAAMKREDADHAADRAALLAEEAEQAIAFTTLVRVGKTAHDKVLRDIYKKKRDMIKKTAEKIINSVEAVESDYIECGEVTVILAEMLKKFSDILWEKKCEKNNC